MVGVIHRLELTNHLTFIRWGKVNHRTRGNVWLIHGLLTVVLWIGFGCAAPEAIDNRHGESVRATIQPTPTAMVESVTTSEPTSDVREGMNKLPATITKVVDGDTMHILIDGKEETIRLLLVDTPETVSPSQPIQPFGPEASSFAKRTLNGKKVEIEIDVSERDKYGRLLCYLYIGDQMFQEMLLEQGLARVAYIYPPNVKYVDEFRNIQRKAQLKAKGIWSIENYAQEDGFHEEIVNTSAKPNPSLTPTSNGDVVYKNCTAVRKAGKAPIRKGDPGYSKRLDRDGDGIACE